MRALMLLLISVNFIFSQLPPVDKPFYKMTHRDIGELVRQTSEQPLTITQKMNYLSQFFLGTHYNLHCTGDGADALLEAWPLVNFKETNCMALCEHVLALSISDSWDNFFDNLQQIRYRDGLIGMKTRNHYTMADWLPQNSWLLQDVSRAVGGAFTKTMTRTISHRTFFKNKGISDMRDVLPDRTITIDYIPLDKVLSVRQNIQTGDVGAILFADKKDIFSAHMFLIAEKNGQKYVREASMSKMTTLDTPLDRWFKDKLKYSAQRYAGIALMRVRAELNKPGKIIKPWDIFKIKEQR